jgi:hypothetical protein
VAKRLTEVHALELAIEEIYGNRLLWDYGHFYDDPDTPQMLNHSKARNGEPGGACYAVRLDDDGVNRLFIWSGYVKGYEKAVIPNSYVEFVHGMMKEAGRFNINVVVHCSNIKVSDVIYRGAPCYGGLVWRDWVRIDWGGTRGITQSHLVVL